MRRHPAVGVSERHLTVALAALFLAAFVTIDPSGFNGYVAGKVLLSCVALLALVWLATRGGPELGIGRFGLLVVVASAWGAVSVVLAESPTRAFWGVSLRLGGLVTWSLFGVAAWVGASLWRRTGPDAGRALCRAAVVGCGAVVAFGLLEIVGVDWNADALEFEGRARSTLGNPAVLSSVLLLLIPLVLVEATERDRWGVTARVVAGGAAVCFVAAETRGAILAAGVAVIVLVLARPTRWRPWILGGGLVLAAATVLSGRWGSVRTGFDGRWAIWEVALAAIRDRPVFGHGPEHFAFAYSDHVRDATVIEFGREDIVDRAHNVVLEAMVAFGVGGLVIAAALGLVARRAIEAMRAGNAVTAALGVGALGYVGQLLVGIVHPTVDLVFWLLVGVLVAAVDPEQTRWSVPQRAGPIAAGALIAVAFVNATFVVGYDRRLDDALEADTFPSAAAALESAIDQRPFDDLGYALQGELLANTLDGFLVVAGLEQLDDGLDRLPRHELVVRAHGDVALQAYRLTAEERHLENTLAVHDDVIVHQPANGQAFLTRGVVLFELGRFDEARTDWLEAERLLPGRAEPTQNLAVLDELDP